MELHQQFPVRALILSRLFGIVWLFGMVSVGHAADTGTATDEKAEPQYPLAVAADGDTLYVVDLDFPGVWKIQADQRELFVQGSKRFRTPLNPPRCIALHPEGGIAVGDSATREVYHIAGPNSEPQPLCRGQIGIAMALAVSPDGQTIYVGDAEKRNLVRIPLGGGDPESVVSINARGLAFDHDGVLWAVTPDDAAIYRIDVDAKVSTPVITGRPYQYPNGLVWAGEFGLVTDGYGRTIWKFTSDGKTSPWYEGAPLIGPVGIATDGQTVWVADPKQVQVFQFNQAGEESIKRL